MTSVKRYLSQEELSAAAAEAFGEEARESIESRGRFLVALSGGSTPLGLYRHLVRGVGGREIDWSRVEFFWGDERPVPPRHQDSNYRMAAESLLRPLDISETRIHRMKAELEDLDKVAWAYQYEIAGVCGVLPEGPPPALDLILLGMGRDGHTASLFPRTSALREKDRWVRSNRVPQLNTERVTLTVPIINQARNIHFLVAGEEKQSALAAVLQGPADSDRWPSQLIRPHSGKLVWFVDAAAAEGLDPGN